MASPADFVFYGGAAGGGKTFAVLLEAMRHVDNPQFGAVLFRRTYPQITNIGGMWAESKKLYPFRGGWARENDLDWTFPSGSKIKFAHMQYEDTKREWDGAQVPLFCFDELGHFTRGQFFYMLSRNRSTCGVRPYMRATGNPVPPDDKVGGWIHEFIGWYLREDGFADPAKAGCIRWFVVDNDTLHWGATAQELRAEHPAIEPKSFTFIPSSVYDNRILLKADPGYLANLQALPYVEQQRLLAGNWLVKPAAGKVFNRAWFEIVDAAPAGGREVRGWDLAATEKKVSGDDPDYTAGVKMRKVGDTFYIMDCIEERGEPARIDAIMKNTATQDGRACAQRFELEGGASGKRDARYLVSMLAGFDVRPVQPHGDKLVRARALSAQALAGNVKLLRGAWNERWLNHMHAIPDAAHDDIMDASSIAFNALIGAGTGRKIIQQAG